MTADSDAPLPDANVRAASYYIARTSATCPNCGGTTSLTALAFAAGHETRDDESDAWQRVEANGFCFHVAAVSPAVDRRLRRDTPNFRFVRTESGNDGWANHCEHCGSSISEDELHGEPGDHGFVPCSEAHAARVVLIAVREPFEASAGGMALEPEFFRFMRRV